MVNALVPNARVLTGEISQALNSGKHTTTSTALYWVGERPDSVAVGHTGTAIIDSPGFQEFGLQHIPQNQLATCMPDLKQHVQDCKFYNCTHLHEPGCGVLSALQKDESIDLVATQVSMRRHRIYAQLFEELGQQRWEISPIGWPTTKVRQVPATSPRFATPDPPLAQNVQSPVCAQECCWFRVHRVAEMRHLTAR